MTARPIPSCSSAPTVGGICLRAATTMAAPLSPSPTQMLSRARRSVRRLIAIASASRPGSSARMTASAASAVIPPPPLASATPTVAVLSAGASLVPSPVITTGSPAFTRRWTIATLASGSRSTVRLLDPDLLRDRGRVGLAVPGEQHGVTDAKPAEPVEQLGEAGTHPIGGLHGAYALPLHDDHGPERGRGCSGKEGSETRFSLRLPGDDVAPGPYCDPPPLDDTGDALARRL